MIKTANVKNIITMAIVFLSLGLSHGLYSVSPLKLKLDRKFSVGESKPVLNSISAVQEDRKGNFYILDRKAFNVHKFSTSGKYLLSFGNKGEGPGDIIRPNTLSLTSDGKIIVNEERDFLSIFDENGVFLEKIKIPSGLSLHYLNDNLFYAWVWTPEKKQQVLLNRNGKIVKTFFSVPKEAFSVNVADETGRAVMFSFFAREYSPYFIFSQYKNQSIVGISNKYEILLLNRNGTVTNKIHRRIKPGTFKPAELKYLENEINSQRKLPGFVQKKLAAKIPKFKNYFTQILLSDQYIWLFRVADNIAKENSVVPVDLYTHDMTFKGKITLKKPPVFISEKRIYFIETNEEDDLILEICNYSIK
jgi:hypothetical protein